MSKSTAAATRTTVPKPGWCIPARCARNSARRPKALFLTQGYVYDTAEQCEARFKGEDPGFIYSRYSNPTIAMFEQRMIELEGAEACRSTATGMAAVTTAVLAPLKAGDHVVASKQMFGSCRYVVEDLLPRYGIASTLVEWARSRRSGKRRCGRTPRRFFLESPTNPTLDVLDIPAIAEIAHAGGARLIVDNVFATPIWQSPLSLGADVVVYSATKHIDGQGRCLGGVILVDGSLHRRAHPQFHAPDRAVAVAVQCLGAAEGTGDAGDPRARADRDGGEGRRCAGNASEDFAADLSRPQPIIRRPRW